MHDANYLFTAGQSVFVFIHMSSLLSLKEQNTQIYVYHIFQYNCYS